MITAEKARLIKMIIFDVDGVLTDGKIIIGPDGEVFKAFSAHDGMGITLAHKAGIKTAIITGRNSEIVKKRCQELAINDIIQGSANKVTAMHSLAERYCLEHREIAYVGDDLNDIPVMRQVGLACGVANAVEEVRTAAHFIASRKGGDGAVREIIQFILKAKNIWDKTLSDYLYGGGIADTRQ